MSPTPRSKTILVVDDEPLVLSLTNSMLSRSGYDVVAADSGKAALRLFELWPDAEVDLALIDLIMPEMNGVQLAERIHELRPALPILFFSAYSDQEILRPIFARGLPYIAKPLSSVQLINRIREVLYGPKSESECHPRRRDGYKTADHAAHVARRPAVAVREYRARQCQKKRSQKKRSQKQRRMTSSS